MTDAQKVELSIRAAIHAKTTLELVNCRTNLTMSLVIIQMIKELKELSEWSEKVVNEPKPK